MGDVHVIAGRPTVPAVVRRHIVRLPVERPVAVLLTWWRIGIVGAKPETMKTTHLVQDRAVSAVAGADYPGWCEATVCC